MGIFSQYLPLVNFSPLPAHQSVVWKDPVAGREVPVSSCGHPTTAYGPPPVWCSVYKSEVYLQSHTHAQIALRAKKKSRRVWVASLLIPLMRSWCSTYGPLGHRPAKHLGSPVTLSIWLVPWMSMTNNVLTHCLCSRSRRGEVRFYQIHGYLE